ncbi:MAG: sigma-70 family RNA polymerase sigma factor [Planctomycetota bacterium]
MIELPDSLVFRARDGDDEAARSLVELLHRPILGVCHRFLGPRFREQIEDIAQDVFLKIFRALPQFDPSRARFTTWVYTFVRNHCFDVLKKRRLPTSSLSPVDADDTDRELRDDRERSPGRNLENRELGDRIQQAIQALGEDQRMVFVLREYEGLDYAAIAVATGVSEGTVKSRLFRAKEALRARLEPWLGEDA